MRYYGYWARSSICVCIYNISSVWIMDLCKFTCTQMCGLRTSWASWTGRSEDDGKLDSFSGTFSSTIGVGAGLGVKRRSAVSPSGGVYSSWPSFPSLPSDIRRKGLLDYNTLVPMQQKLKKQANEFIITKIERVDRCSALETTKPKRVKTY